MTPTINSITPPNVIAYSLIGLFGVVIGSFLSVVVYRLPIMITSKRPITLFAPRSHCTSCQRQLPWWATIPLLSYLCFRGKSRCCQQTIAPRYVLIETLSLITTLACVQVYGLDTTAMAAMIFCWACIALMFIDIETMLLPDRITIPLLWLGLLVNINHPFCPLQDAVIGAIAGYCVFWFFGWLFKRLRGIASLGHGDYKFIAMLGAWLGWQALPGIIAGASVLGAGYAGFRMLRYQDERTTPIPFGPFLASAGMVMLLLSQQLTWI